MASAIKRGLAILQPVMIIGLAVVIPSHHHVHPGRDVRPDGFAILVLKYSLEMQPMNRKTSEINSAGRFFASRNHHRHHVDRPHRRLGCNRNCSASRIRHSGARPKRSLCSLAANWTATNWTPALPEYARRLAGADQTTRRCGQLDWARTRKAENLKDPWKNDINTVRRLRQPAV